MTGVLLDGAVWPERRTSRAGEWRQRSRSEGSERGRAEYSVSSIFHGNLGSGKIRPRTECMEYGCLEMRGVAKKGQPMFPVSPRGEFFIRYSKLALLDMLLGEAIPPLSLSPQS